MPAVQAPSTNNASVSLVPRPQRLCTAIEMAVPTGRATKASEKMANAISVPSRRDKNGNSSEGNTSTLAMPNTKKSKYSDERPMTTPTAISLGVTSSSVCAPASDAEPRKPGTGSAAEPWLTILTLLKQTETPTVLHLSRCAYKRTYPPARVGKP